MKRHKANMGVEGPSFYEYQKHGPEPERKKSFFESIFGGAPESGPGIPPEAAAAAAATRSARMRPGFHAHDPYSLNPERWFEVDRLWAYVEEMKKTYRIRLFPVTVLTSPAIEPGTRTVNMNVAAGEIAQFFGIPVSAFQNMTLADAYTNVFEPFMSAVAQGLNQMKSVNPFLVPGYVRFDLDDTGALILVYEER